MLDYYEALDKKENYVTPPGHKGINNWEIQGNERLPIILENTKNFGIAIDGGAFVGLFTNYFAKFFEQVYAFEPVNFKLLETNVCGDNIIISDKGISDKIETVNMGVNHVGFGGIEHKTNVRKINCITIDSLELKDVGLIKLDLEGMDLKGMVGADETVKRDRPTICIEHKMDVENIRKHMENLGYKKVYEKKPDQIWVPL
jgi:FkbM family methyltransferase